MSDCLDKVERMLPLFNILSFKIRLVHVSLKLNFLVVFFKLGSELWWLEAYFYQF